MQWYKIMAFSRASTVISDSFTLVLQIPGLKGSTEIKSNGRGNHYSIRPLNHKEPLSAHIAKWSAANGIPIKEHNWDFFVDYILNGGIDDN